MSTDTPPHYVNLFLTDVTTDCPTVAVYSFLTGDAGIDWSPFHTRAWAKMNITTYKQAECHTKARSVQFIA